MPIAAGYTTLGKSLKQLWTDHVQGDPAWEVRMRPAWEIQRACLVRAVHSRRQLRELLVTFWHDHLNVMATDYSAGPVYVHYDREVIRATAFGRTDERTVGKECVSRCRFRGCPSHH